MSLKKIKLAFISILLIAMSFSAFSAEFTAKVLAVSGKVERLENDKWVAIAVGDSIKKGTVIQTGFKSTMSLSVQESVVNISPLTRMTVEQFAETEEKDNTSLFVSTGKITSDVRRRDNRKVGFVVRSPVATASVRGTIVSLRNRYKFTEVRNDRGLVATWPSGQNAVASVIEGDTDVTEVTENNLQKEQNVVLRQSQGVDVNENGILGNIQDKALQEVSGYKVPDYAATSEAQNTSVASGYVSTEAANSAFHKDSNNSNATSSGNAMISVSFPGH